MRKRVLRTLVLLSLLLASAADAQDASKYYVTLGGGALFATDADGTPVGTISFDAGYSLNAGIGRQIYRGDGVAFDLHAEVLFNSQQINDDDVENNSLSSDQAESLSWMLSGIFDFYLAPQFSFYLGAGAGWASSIEFQAFDQPGNFRLEDDNGFAYQGRAGFKYGLGGYTDVSLGYRFFSIESVDIIPLAGPNSELDYDRHVVEIVMSWSL